MKVKKNRVSRASPRGWPTEKEWSDIERRLAKAKPTKVLPTNASAVDRIKHELCAQFVQYCREKELTQRELAKLLGVTESRVSEIVHYHYGRFTIDKLLELLSIIKPKLKFNVA